MQIIGLGHYSRTGKDTLANSLLASLEEHSPGRIKAAKIPFAWKLKQIAYDLYSWAGLEMPEFYEIKENEYLRDVVLEGLGMTPVQIWVAVGTPAMRQNVYDKTWIDYVLKTDHDLDVLIIPDVRFPNEVKAVREAGGKLVKVVRPGYGPRPTVADRALVGFTDWDYVVGSGGSMDELRRYGSLFANGFITGNMPAVHTVAQKAKACEVEVITPYTPPTTVAYTELKVDGKLAKRILDLNTISAVHGCGGLEGDVLEKLIALAAAA